MISAGPADRESGPSCKTTSLSVDMYVDSHVHVYIYIHIFHKYIPLDTYIYIDIYIYVHVFSIMVIFIVNRTVTSPNSIYITTTSIRLGVVTIGKLGALERWCARDVHPDPCWLIMQWISLKLQWVNYIWVNTYGHWVYAIFISTGITFLEFISGRPETFSGSTSWSYQPQTANRFLDDRWRVYLCSSTADTASHQSWAEDFCNLRGGSSTNWPMPEVSETHYRIVQANCIYRSKQLPTFFVAMNWYLYCIMLAL